MAENAQICDEYFNGAGKIIVDKCDEAEELLSAYIKVLKQVQEKGLIEGKTHDAIAAFTESVEAFRKEFQNQADAIKITNKLLIENCDMYDKDLY